MARGRGSATETGSRCDTALPGRRRNRVRDKREPPLLLPGLLSPPIRLLLSLRRPARSIVGAPGICTSMPIKGAWRDVACGRQYTTLGRAQSRRCYRRISDSRARYGTHLRWFGITGGGEGAGFSARPSGGRESVWTKHRPSPSRLTFGEPRRGRTRFPQKAVIGGLFLVGVFCDNRMSVDHASSARGDRPGSGSV